MQPTLSGSSNNSTNGLNGRGANKTPENFLGENSSLVNLDNLLGASTTANTGKGNPDGML